jgi:hypothetical protein
LSDLTRTAIPDLVKYKLNKKMLNADITSKMKWLILSTASKLAQKPSAVLHRPW